MMRLRVLGCSGGELPGHRSTSFLIDDAIALDAGALTASLQLEELAKIEHVVLTHSHLDHVKDLPLLADLLAGRRRKPLVAHASTGCARTLRESVFNDRLWPDFTRIPHAGSPVLAIAPFSPRRRFTVGRYTFAPVPVAHPVESVGFIVSSRDGAFALSGDTGPTDAFWTAVNAAPDLRALLVETSFPTRLQRVADSSGHLTPRTLARELRKLERHDVPILLYHLKPAYAPEIRRELAALDLEGVRVLEPGDELRFQAPPPPTRARVTFRRAARAPAPPRPRRRAPRSAARATS